MNYSELVSNNNLLAMAVGIVQVQSDFPEEREFAVAVDLSGSIDDAIEGLLLLKKQYGGSVYIGLDEAYVLIRRMETQEEFTRRRQAENERHAREVVSSVWPYGDYD